MSVDPRAIIGSLRLDNGPKNEPIETTADKIRREYQPHIIGHCGICKAHNQEVTIGRNGSPIIQCPSCRARYRYRADQNGTWLSDTGRQFITGGNK